MGTETQDGTDYLWASPKPRRVSGDFQRTGHPSATINQNSPLIKEGGSGI